MHMTQRRSGRSPFARSAPYLFALFVAVSPLLVWEAYQTIRGNSNKVADWLPKTFVETGDLQWFRSQFAADQFVIISWDDCRLGGDARRRILAR